MSNLFNSQMSELTKDIVDKDNVQLVSFNIGKEEFALNINFIQEIIKFNSITNVPLTLPYVKGVINIRGSIIPVISLRLRMGFPEIDFNLNTRIIVISLENRKVGLIVDEMNEVLRVSESFIQTSPNSLEEDNVFSDSVCVLGDRLITILNLNKLIEAK